MSDALVEPCPIPVTFCDGLAKVDVDRNGNVHLLFFCRQSCLEGADTERVLTARLLMPKAAMVETAKMMLGAAEPSEAASVSVLRHMQINARC